MKKQKLFYSLDSTLVMLFWLGWILLFWSWYLASGLHWYVLIIVFFLAILCLCLSVLIITSRKMLYIAIAVATFPVVALAKGLFYFMVPIWILCVLLLISGARKIKNEEQNRIRIEAHRLVRFGIPTFTTAIALLIAGAYFFFLKGQQKVQSYPAIDLEIPMFVTSAGIKTASAIVPQEDLTLISQGATVDQYIEASAKTQIEANEEEKQEYIKALEKQLGRALTPEEIEGVTEATIEAYDMQKMIVKQRQNLSKQLGIKIKGDEQVLTVVNALINQKIDEFFNGANKKKTVVPISLAFVLLLTLKSIGWILTYPLSWTVKFLYHIMHRIKIIKVTKVHKEVEQIIGT